MAKTKLKLLTFIGFFSGLFNISQAQQPSQRLESLKNSNVRNNINSYGANIHGYAQK